MPKQADLQRTIDELQRELDARTAELAEARSQQAATAEILEVINAAHADLTPVFNAILRKAHELCGIAHGSLQLCDGDSIFAVAVHGVSDQFAEILRRPRPIAESAGARALLQGARCLHIKDARGSEFAGARRSAEIEGTRTILGVPLRRDGCLLGAIFTTRYEVKPFTEKEIGLLEGFAAQAVLAIENARLLNEVQARTRDLSESLRQQTATADVLKVISRSTFDLQKVLDTLTESVCRLCEAYDAVILLCDGEYLRIAAHYGEIGVVDKWPISRDWVSGRCVVDRRPIYVHDLWAEEAEFPKAHAFARQTGHRTLFAVPLLRDQEVIGAINIRRTEVRPFTDKQIELVTTFADQAVIAIENARLFGEVQQRTRDLSESLQQQTATADVLKVISRSAFDLHTVLDTLTQSAAQLCNADMGSIARKDADGYYHATNYKFAVDWVRVTDPLRMQPGKDSVIGRALLAKKAVQIIDVLEDAEYGYPDMQKAAGYRTLLGVPLMRQGEAIGVLFLGRKTVEPFTDKQIELVSTFADQAVIAIENVRLFDEVQAKTHDLEEALRYQTGSANILNVIASSPTDVQPVLEAIVEGACELCEANDAAVLLKDGEHLRFRAHHGPIAINLEKFPITRGWTAGRAFLDGKPVHLRDTQSEEAKEFPDSRVLAIPPYTNFSVRTVLSVPLLRESERVGVILLRRIEMRPFSDKQISLLQTFADQAVIAINNAHLFDEVQAKTRDLTEALTYQTGSANILNVIASSPTDVQPVLRAIVESACELCAAYDALVILKEGGELQIYAHHGPIPHNRTRWPNDRTSTSGRAIADQRPVHVHDVLSDEGLEFPVGRSLSLLDGCRTLLSAPLLREGEAIGAIALRRAEVHPFSDKQIALLQTFADQAVIALGNVRLFDEVQAKTHDLEEALRYQTGSANILNVIASSPTDVAPVLKAIVESACELCEAYDANVLLRHGDELHYSAHHGPIPTGTSARPISREWVTGRSVVDKVPVQISDFESPEAAEFPEGRRQSREQGHRCTLSVPLLREGEAIGAIVLRRIEPIAFSEKQINLLQTFADQAVIAIGNVRLFDEVQAKTRDLTEALTYQTGSANILNVIASSPTDVRPVLKAIVESACEVCEAYDAAVVLKDGDDLRFSAHHGPIPIGLEKWPINRNWTAGRAFIDRKPVHIEDLRDKKHADFSDGRELSLRMGHRSILSVPLLRESVSIGAIVLRRTEVNPFTEKQIALLQTFADQAVIAIGNVRLFDEVQARTRELSKSIDDLRAAQDRLIQTEKLASLGQLTAGIAHEIKNPLNFVNNFAALSVEITDELNDTLKQASVADKIRAEVDELTGLLKDNLSKVVQHGKRADSIVKNMLLHSREGSGERRLTDINALVDESLNLAYHGARAERPQFNVSLQRDFDPEAGMIEMFPQEITRVFLNLLSNGFYAVTKRKAEIGEAFEPTVSTTTKGRTDHVEIRIRDNGTGIPNEVKERIFNPFFTTKPAGEGTGLGLSMSHDIIVKQHGGAIEVETTPGEFTEFRIVLPRTNNLSNKSRG